MPQTAYAERFQIEHIIPRKHGGPTSLENLALACMDCNLRKGTNLSGIDPQTRKVVELFHPRKDSWRSHFRWNGIQIEGRTAKGRATLTVLELNRPPRLAVRALLETLESDSGEKR